MNYLPNRALSLRQALDANGNNTCYIAAKTLPFMEFLLKENKKLQQKKLDLLGIHCFEFFFTLLELLVQRRNQLLDKCKELEKEEEEQKRLMEEDEKVHDLHFDAYL